MHLNFYYFLDVLFNLIYFIDTVSYVGHIETQCVAQAGLVLLSCWSQSPNARITGVYHHI